MLDELPTEILLMIYSYIPYYQPILASINRDMNSIFRIEALFTAGYIQKLYNSNYYKTLFLPCGFSKHEHINRNYFDKIKTIYMYKIAADFAIMRNDEYLHNFKFSNNNEYMMSSAVAECNIELIKYIINIKHLPNIDTIKLLIYTSAYNQSDEVFKYIHEYHISKCGKKLYMNDDSGREIFENLLKSKRVNLMKYWIDLGFNLGDNYEMDAIFSNMNVNPATYELINDTLLFRIRKFIDMAGDTETCRFLINNGMCFNTKKLIDLAAAQPKKYDYLIPIIRDILTNFILSISHGDRMLFSEYDTYEKSLISLNVFQDEIQKVNMLRR